MLNIQKHYKTVLIKRFFVFLFFLKLSCKKYRKTNTLVLRYLRIELQYRKYFTINLKCLKIPYTSPVCNDVLLIRIFTRKKSFPNVKFVLLCIFVRNDISIFFRLSYLRISTSNDHKKQLFIQARLQKKYMKWHF